jgi:hypothetical protein
MRRGGAVKLAMLALVTSACAIEPYAPLESMQERAEVLDLPAYLPTRLDVLFVVDRSPAMAAHQDALRTGFADFGNTTSGAGWKDYRLGVISADATDDGMLIHEVVIDAPRFGGGRVTKYDGTLAEALASIGPLGAGGAARVRALDMLRRGLEPGRNPGFHRPEAKLLVVIVTATDDDSDVAPEELREIANGWVRDPGAVAIAVFHAADAPRLARLRVPFSNRTLDETLLDRLGTALVLFPAPLRPYAGDPCFRGRPTGECVVLDGHRGDERLVDHCDVAPAPCWRIAEDYMNCPLDRHLYVDVRRTQFPEPETHVLAHCITH